MQILILRKPFFGSFPENSKNFLLRSSISFFEMFFWLGLRLKTPTKKKSNQNESSLFWGKNVWVKNVGGIKGFLDDVIVA